ncbi:single-stranded DNA-binding protein [Salmonella enterica]|nr:single-stranded DNA-binding protein [Salmonella enterica]
MNSAYLTLSGRMNSDPVERQTKSGLPMATGFAAAQFVDNNGTNYLNVSLVAFGDVAGLLLRHNKGDSLTVYGSFAPTSYRGKDGETKSGFTLTCQGIQSARVSPARRQGQGQGQNHHRGADAQGPGQNQGDGYRYGNGGNFGNGQRYNQPFHGRNGGRW